MSKNYTVAGSVRIMSTLQVTKSRKLVTLQHQSQLRTELHSRRSECQPSLPFRTTNLHNLNSRPLTMAGYGIGSSSRQGA